MSCQDYQTIIRQWFDDVMETHISKCDSCAEFFRGLNSMTLNYLEQRRIAVNGQSGQQGDEQPSGNVQMAIAETSFPEPSSLAPPPIPPKAIGATGRLNTGPEIDTSNPGLICNIGRFILDERELDMLRSMTTAEPSELGLRILTIKALEDLRGVLNDITQHEDVIGWAIIGGNGLMVAGFFPEDINAENLAVRALSIYMGTEDMLERIGTEKLQQIILHTEHGAVFLANFGEGIFITLTNAKEPAKILRTLKKIRDVS